MTKILPDGQISKNLSSPARKNILLSSEAKSPAYSASSLAHKRGVSRSSRTLGAGCDGRFGARDERGRGGRQNRVVLISRRWDQVSRDDLAKRRWLASPVHRGERVTGVKTIAQGMPALLRFTCGPTPVLFLLHRAHGCDRHPAFPAPSVLRATKTMHHSGETRRGNAKLFPLVIASEAKFDS